MLSFDFLDLKMNRKCSLVFFSPFFKLKSLSQGCASLVALLITTLLARKDSGAAESFSEGHLWLTVPGRLCHPVLIANEQTQGFSLRFIIVTMNEFKVLLVVVLSILSSHQPINHLSRQTSPLCQLKYRRTHCENAHKHRYTQADTHPRTKSDQLIKMWWLSGKKSQTGPDRCLTLVTSKGN